MFVGEVAVGRHRPHAPNGTDTAKWGWERRVRVASMATIHSSLGGFSLPRPRRLEDAAPRSCVAQNVAPKMNTPATFGARRGYISARRGKASPDPANLSEEQGRKE